MVARESRGSFGAVGRGDQQVPDLLGGASVFRSEAQEDVEAPDPLEDLPRGVAADGDAHRLLDVGHVDAVAGEGGSVDGDAKLRRAGDLVLLHVGRAGNGADDRFDLGRLGLEHLHVGTEELHRQLRLDAAEQLVHRRGDGLGEVELHPGKVLQRLPHPGQQLLQRPCGGPLLLGLEPNEGLGVVDRVGMGADLAAPDAGDDPGHFGEVLHQPLLEALHGVPGVLQGDGGRHGGADHQVPFVHGGNEFRPETGEEKAAADEQQRPPGRWAPRAF